MCYDGYYEKVRVIFLLYSKQNYKKNIIKTTKHNSVENTLQNGFLGQLSFFLMKYPPELGRMPLHVIQKCANSSEVNGSYTDVSY